MMTPKRLALLFGLLVLAWPSMATRAQQPLETETARPPQKGAFEVQTAFEYQTSKEGTERALPFAFEYGITDRLSIMAEPVFYTAIRPKVGTRATGIGDLEVTLSYLFAREKGSRPALAIAGEVKVPTAGNILIGSRKTDFTAYLIASKRFGKFDAHANVGYTFVGKPAGTQFDKLLQLCVGGRVFRQAKVYAGRRSPGQYRVFARGRHGNHHYQSNHHARNFVRRVGWDARLSLSARGARVLHLRRKL